jgi:diadenosine tetraphosphate (Ap4A) HIT family hydrolase
MARINCDPYAGFHLFALVNRVTGLLDREEEVNATVRALEADGVEPDDIDIFTGELGVKCLDLSGREHGRAVRLLRTLEAAVGHEGETHHRIDEALHHGASLLCVRIHKARSDEKARAFRVLQALHAHEIHYWGTWGFEDVPSTGTACALCTLPGERILGENEYAVWIPDAHPVSPGHSLIISKRHVESFFDTVPEEREGILALLATARAHLNKDRAPQGYNIGINEGAAAGQTVPHLHVHLIPRFTGDRKNPRGGVRWVIPDKADYWSPR